MYYRSSWSAWSIGIRLNQEDVIRILADADLANPLEPFLCERPDELISLVLVIIDPERGTLGKRGVGPLAVQDTLANLGHAYGPDEVGPLRRRSGCTRLVVDIDVQGRLGETGEITERSQPYMALSPPGLRIPIQLTPPVPRGRPASASLLGKSSPRARS